MCVCVSSPTLTFVDVYLSLYSLSDLPSVFECLCVCVCVCVCLCVLCECVCVCVCVCVSDPDLPTVTEGVKSTLKQH